MSAYLLWPWGLSSSAGCHSISVSSVTMIRNDIQDLDDDITGMLRLTGRLLVLPHTVEEIVHSLKDMVFIN